MLRMFMFGFMFTLGKNCANNVVDTLDRKIEKMCQKHFPKQYSKAVAKYQQKSETVKNRIGFKFEDEG